MKRDWLSCFWMFLMFLTPGCKNYNSKNQPGQSQHRIIQSNITRNQEIRELVQLKIEPSSKKEKLSNLLSVQKLIFLENNPPLGQISKVIHKNGFFYVLDGTASKLYGFSESGKLIFEFGNKGEANGEVLGLDDFTISKSGKSIFILDHKGMGISEIDGTTGNFVSKISLDLFAHQIGITENEEFILFSDFSIWNEELGFNIIFMNKKGEIPQMYFPISKKESQLAFSKAHSLNSQNLFSPLLNDTIYAINSEGPYPLYYLDFGNKKLDYINYTSSELRKLNLFCEKFATRADHIHETKSSLFFTFCYEDGYYSFYNKQNGLLHSIATDLLEDDLFGECISIKPSGIDESETYFIHTLDPFLIHDQIDFVLRNNSKESYERWMLNQPLMREVYENTTPNDNPILVFTLFKQNL